MTRPRFAAACACLFAAALLAGCGEREDPTPGGGAPEKLDLVLDYVPNVDHAGIYAALGTGAFRDVRLAVTPRVPGSPSEPLKLLSAGRADLAISYEPEVLLARDKGARVVSIGALVQTPLTSIMSVGPRAIRDPRQLRGKRVGTAGIPYQSAYLRAILDRAGVPRGSVREVNVGFNLVPAMVGKRVDATLGAFWNVEGVQLQRARRRPAILRMDRIGVPTYNELVVVAREEDARRRGPLLRRFMYALSRGHAALRRDPETGLRPLVRANRDLDPALQRAQLRATLPVFFPAGRDRPFGYQDPERWAAYAGWMARNRLIRQREDPRRALTNEFLPGEGPAPQGP